MPWLKAFRLLNLFIVAMTQFLIKYCVIHRLTEFTQSYFPDKLFIVLVMSTLCLTTFAYFINDYFDYELDRQYAGELVNDISKQSLYLAAMSSCIVGFILSAWLAYQAGLLHLLWIYPLAIFGLFMYSWKLKSLGLIGNIVVALFTSFVIGIVCIAETGINYQAYPHLIDIILSFMIFSFLINLYREIIKDIEDHHEDKAFGHQTLPLRIGVDRAKLTALFIGGFLSILVLLYSIFNCQVLYKQAYLCIGIVLPLFIILYCNGKAQQTSDYKLISQLLKAVMFLGLVFLLF